MTVLLKKWSEKFFEFGAYVIFTTTCQTEDENHWSYRVLDFFWVDCPCCLLFRGFTVGSMIGGSLGLGLGAAIMYLITM